MIRILIIAQLPDCRAIESIAKDSLNVGDNAAIIYSSTQEETWQTFTDNPYVYDFAIVDLGQDDISLYRNVKLTEKAVSYNRYMEIIFMTARKYVPVDVYGVQHIHMLKKPLTNEKIRDMITLMIRRRSFSDEYSRLRFQVRHGRNIHMIHRDDVRYVRKARYGIDLMSIDGILPCDKKIEQFLHEWGSSFFRCHDSFAVNVNHVMEIRNNSVFLCNGEEIPVSRSYKKSVKEYFDRLHFWNIKKSHN